MEDEVLICPAPNAIPAINPGDYIAIKVVSVYKEMIDGKQYRFEDVEYIYGEVEFFKWRRSTEEWCIKIKGYDELGTLLDIKAV